MAETKKTTETKAVKSSETKTAAKTTAAKKTTTAAKATTTKAAATKTTTKATATKKAAPAKVEAAPVAEAKVEVKAAPKAKAKGDMLKVTLVKSGAGRLIKQKRTLEALGLRKTNSSNIVPDNAATRGMIFVVKHLVSVEKV